MKERIQFHTIKFHNKKKIWIKNLYKKLDYLKNDLVKFYGVIKNELFFGDLDFICSIS